MGPWNSKPVYNPLDTFTAYVATNDDELPDSWKEDGGAADRYEEDYNQKLAKARAESLEAFRKAFPKLSESAQSTQHDFYISQGWWSDPAGAVSHSYNPTQSDFAWQNKAARAGVIGERSGANNYYYGLTKGYFDNSVTEKSQSSKDLYTVVRGRTDKYKEYMPAPDAMSLSKPNLRRPPQNDDPYAEALYEPLAAAGRKRRDVSDSPATFGQGYKAPQGTPTYTPNDVKNNWLDQYGRGTANQVGDIFGYFLDTARERDRDRGELRERSNHNTRINAGQNTSGDTTTADDDVVLPGRYLGGPISRRDLKVSGQLLKMGGADLQLKLKELERQRLLVYRGITDDTVRRAFAYDYNDYDSIAAIQGFSGATSKEKLANYVKQVYRDMDTSDIYNYLDNKHLLVPDDPNETAANWNGNTYTRPTNQQSTTDLPGDSATAIETTFTS